MLFWLWPSCSNLHALAWSHACTHQNQGPCPLQFQLCQHAKCVVDGCRTSFESSKESWLSCQPFFLLCAPHSWTHIYIDIFSQRGPLLLGDGHAFTMTHFWLWNLLDTRTSGFSINGLWSDTWRVELLQCCPPVNTSVTRHHCDSSCASKSIVLLKQENNSYTCSCSYFSLFLHLVPLWIPTRHTLF